MKLRIRKVVTVSSANEFWILFPEGDITKPLCLLDKYEAGQLLQDMIDECEQEKAK